MAVDIQKCLLHLLTAKFCVVDRSYFPLTFDTIQPVAFSDAL